MLTIRLTTTVISISIYPGRFLNYLPGAKTGSSVIREGRIAVVDTKYLTFSFAHKGIDFIEKNKAHPFFLTFSFNAPHDPFQVPKEYFNRITGVEDSETRVYYGMIEALDDAVGLVKEKSVRGDRRQHDHFFHK